MYNGILIVNKEKDFTSHDVVAKLRGICKQKKIGHTGTLDPDATGVLPVCLGNATKLCDILTDKTKEYIATLRLGIVTDTLDMTGTILEEREVSVSEEEVRKEIGHFLGKSLQVPPMYSALKINGKKLYQLAREGKTVERQPREIEIKELEILEVQLPLVRFRVLCSKGTYIRSLCDDIGQRLGCGGAMESLQRTRVENFYLKDALTLAQIEELRDENRLAEQVIPVDSVFSFLDKIHVKEAYGYLLENGNTFPCDQIQEDFIKEDKRRFCMYQYDGRFFGIYEYFAEEERLKPYKMFIPKESD